MTLSGNKLLSLAGLFVAEVVAVILFLQVLTDFQCDATGQYEACRMLRGAALRGLSVLAALGLFLWIRKDLLSFLAGAVAAREGGRDWALLHGVGLALAVVPWLAAAPGTLQDNVLVYLALLAAGGAIAAVGAMFWAMPPGDWLRLARAGGGGLWFVLAVGLLIPDLASTAGLAWTVDVVLQGTFYGTAILLTLLGRDVSVGFTPPMIGADDFVVAVAASCSGVEGFALTTGFLAIYAVILRGELRQVRFWVVLWPVALLTSWVLNVLRIAALILIGADVSPVLAENGFHSFAGWLFFTVLALGIVTVVPRIGWLHRAPAAAAAADQAPLPAITQDWAAARIVPFILFMLTGLAVQAFWLHPELGYPLQVAAMLVALWVFRGPLFAVMPRFDWVAVGAGLAVAAVWLALAWPGSGGAPLQGLGTLGPWALAAWVAIRIVGTVLAVPVVEEAFFRGYLMTRLDTGGLRGRVIAVAVSTLAFAALHGRFGVAALAGVVFALVMLRRGRLWDAILCHATANAVIAAAALAAQDWSLI